jgi:hypothetical protein
MPSLRTRVSFDRTALLAVDALVEVAQDAADAAQAAADAAQDDIDAISVPPTGSRVITTSGSLSPTDYAVLVDATAGVVTITLHSASTAENTVLVTKIDGTGNAVNVAPGGGDTLNGAGVAVAISTPNQSRSFASDSLSAWYG